MKQKGFTLIEMLVVIAIIGILAAMLSGPLVSALKSARKTACGNNLGQIGKSLFQYESPSYFGKQPLAGATADYTANVSTMDPLVCLWKATLIDNSQMFVCPVGNATAIVADDVATSIPSLAATAAGPARWAGAVVVSNYNFTLVYNSGSKGSRVIAGDSASTAATGADAFSSNHGDTAAEKVDGANALFKDSHVKASTSAYIVEGAERAVSTADRNLWGTVGIVVTGAGATATAVGTQIGTQTN